MRSGRRRIHVIESKWRGHYAGFAARVAGSLCLRGHAVTLTLTAEDPARTGGMPESAIAGLPKDVQVRRTLAGLPEGFARVDARDARAEWASIRPEMHAVDSDAVVLPSADALVYGRDARRRVRASSGVVAGCIHNARLGYAGDLRFTLRREIMRSRMRRCGMRLGTLDPVAVDAAGPIDLRLLPLPVDPPETRRCRIPPEIGDRLGGRRLVLAIGEHSERKGTDRVVRQWPDPAPEDAVLLVAGRRCRAVDQALAERSADLDAGRILSLDRILSNEEYDGLLRTASVAVAVYPAQVGISAVVVEAAASGTAVLASESGGIGRMVGYHRLGLVVPALDDRRLAEALAEAAIRDPEVDESRRRRLVESCLPLPVGQAWEALLGIDA